MKKLIPWLLLLLVAAALCVILFMPQLLTGNAPAEETTAEVSPEPTTESSPAPTAEPSPEPAPEPSAEPTPEPTAEPSAEPPPEPTPDMSPLTSDYFDDAVFIGDSVTGTLQYYAFKTGELGDALILAKTSYSVRAAVDNVVMLSYRGRDARIERILSHWGAGKVFLMLGMNDLTVIGVDKTMEYWEQLLAAIREECPEVRVFIQSCTPVYDNGKLGELTNELVDEYNARLREFAADNDCTYVEIGAHFKNEEGSLAKEYCRDEYVHLSPMCGEIWANLLKDPANYSIPPR